MIKGVIASKEKVIQNNQGNIFHVIKKESSGFSGFGEAYISAIKYRSIKAWKMHLKMTMNLIVPIGAVQFIFYDHENNLLNNIIIGEDNYCRITVPPKIWCGFKGLSSKTSYILNIADTSHDPLEVERKPLSFLKFLSK